MTKKILLIGDMHCGSENAIMPEEFKTSSTEKERARIVYASPLQNAILDKWHEMVDSVGVVDAIVCNGDLVEGVNRKGTGLGTWTSDMDIQKKVAQKLIKEIKVHNNKIYGTQGTVYHTNDNISVDKLVVEELGGKFGDDIILEINKVRLHCAHKIGVSSSTPQHRFTPIAKELVMAELNKSDFGKFDIIARSHAHYFVSVQTVGGLGLVIPCWKGRDEFVSRIGLAFNPDIGYVVLEIGNDGTYSFTHNIMHLKGDNAIHTHYLDVSDS